MDNMKEYLPENLFDKSVLITGGTTGIGRTTAILLALSGAKIFIVGRNQEPIDETIRAVRDAEPNAIIFGLAADVSREEDLKSVFEAIDSTFHGLDILINNAGLSADGITAGKYSDWQYVINTNLLGYLACANYAAKRMEAKGGHIINIGSMSADNPSADTTVYVATKSGIRGFTKSLRKELNPKGIKVTLIEPGAVSSDMQPGGAEEHLKKIEAMEMLKSDDIAICVLYCLSQPKRCDVISLQIRPHLEII
jgi:NADP-dependent 3-hydroxy acid dehydrogenase YdfG